MVVILLCLLLPLAPSTVYAKNPTVSVEIVKSLNENQPERRESISSISDGGLIKLWGWVKVETTTSGIQPETYYLEWTYDNGTNEVVLDSYARNGYYIFKLRLDRTITYYWITKRIWTDNLGTHRLNVYTKTNGNFELVDQAILMVGGSS